LADDFLVGLRDQMRIEPDVLRQHDACKLAAARQAHGFNLAATDKFVRRVLDSSRWRQPA
jgi:hypothetical protein